MTVNEKAVSRHAYIARQCARGVRGCATDEQYIDLIKRIETALTAAAALMTAKPETESDVRFTEKTKVHDYARSAAFAWRRHALELLKRENVAMTEDRDSMIDECLAQQPSTAENPNEDTYQRGYFDGVMAYGRAILNLKSTDAPEKGK